MKHSDICKAWIHWMIVRGPLSHIQTHTFSYMHIHAYILSYIQIQHDICMIQAHRYKYSTVFVCIFMYLHYMCMYLYLLNVLHVWYVSVWICMYRIYWYVLYVWYVCVCMCMYMLYFYVSKMYDFDHTYIYIQYIHIQTYAFWGKHMHMIYTVYMCQYVTPEYIQYIHAHFNTYTFAQAGSLMLGLHVTPL